MLSSQQPIYEHTPICCPPDRHNLYRYRYQTLQSVHAFVLRNFTRKMSCSTDDIIDVKYSISSIKDFRKHYEINALTVYVANGFSYTFTRYENPDADGLLSDISYDRYMDQPCTGEDDDEWDWAEYRVIYEEVAKLPKRIKEAISLGIIEGDIIVSVPPVKSSFIKHHKRLVKIDRRRKVPEIYKEWDETIDYYPVTLMNRIHIEEPAPCQAAEPIIDTDECPVQTESIMPYPVSIGWSDDEW